MQGIHGHKETNLRLWMTTVFIAYCHASLYDLTRLNFSLLVLLLFYYKIGIPDILLTFVLDTAEVPVKQKSSNQSGFFYLNPKCVHQSFTHLWSLQMLLGGQTWQDGMNI